MWYYVNEGAQFGPLEDAEFEELLRAGKVTVHTLVWREGMPDWQTYGTLGEESTRWITCCECRRQFPPEEAIPYQNLWVCASCKPLFFQRLKEGASLPGVFQYGGFWVRFLAKFIDGMILAVGYLSFFLLATLTSLMPAQGVPQDVVSMLVMVSMYLLNFALALGYTVYFLGKYGATPGKMALGLKVITSDGGALDYKKALVRYFAELLSGILCNIGYLLAAFDEEKRTLHDRICDTRVIRK